MLIKYHYLVEFSQPKERVSLGNQHGFEIQPASIILCYYFLLITLLKIHINKLYNYY